MGGRRATLALGVLWLWASAATADPNVLFVIESSREMRKPWGESTRFQVARSELTQLAESLPERAALGLASFGHNRSEACDDLEVVAPSGATPLEIAITLEGLEPKGARPVAGAVRLAASALDSPGSVVLVASGGDGCGEDACEAARTLASQRPDLRIHVVGIEPAEADGEQLACIASATGGRYARARRPEELAPALAGLRDELLAPPPELPETSAAPPAEAVASPPPGAAKRALLEDLFERDALGDGWEVRRPDADRLALAQGKLLAVATNAGAFSAAPVNLALVRRPPAGDFVARVRVDMKVTDHTSAALFYFVDDESFLAAGIGGWCCESQRRPFFLKRLGGSDNTIDNAWETLGDRPLGGFASGVETWYLEIERAGIKYTARASSDGVRWSEIGTHSVIPKTGRIGLAAWTWSDAAPEHPAEFDDLVIEGAP